MTLHAAPDVERKTEDHSADNTITIVVTPDARNLIISCLEAMYNMACPGKDLSEAYGQMRHSRELIVTEPVAHQLEDQLRLFWATGIPSQVGYERNEFNAAIQLLP